MSSDHSNNNPWAWLGLLKWSLSYSDGTSDASSQQPLSAEDREFLERVMKEGIIDEGDRMKTILHEVTEILGRWHDQNASSSSTKEDEEEQVRDLLEELRDIVEQIDYARAFCALRGLDFLLGCLQQPAVPVSTKQECLGLVATLASNNPPVQTQLLELGALKILSDVFMDDDSNTAALRPRLMQALGATVRSHATAEAVFLQTAQATALLQTGVGMTTTSTTSEPPAESLRKRTVFFLRALATSDTATRARIQQLEPCLGWTADRLLEPDAASGELREMVLVMLIGILEQGHSVNFLLDRKDALAALGVQRVAALRQVDPDEDPNAPVEQDCWERLLVLLAQTLRDEEAPANSDNASPPLLLGPSTSSSLAQ